MDIIIFQPYLIFPSVKCRQIRQNLQAAPFHGKISA